MKKSGKTSSVKPAKVTQGPEVEKFVEYLHKVCKQGTDAIIIESSFALIKSY